MMTKLSDSQRVILSAAAPHQMGLARAPKTLPAAARNAVFRSLIKASLLTEINAPPEHVGLGRRQDEDEDEDEDGTWIVARITDKGLRAIGIDPNTWDAEEENEQSAEAIARRNAERRAAAEAATPVADKAPMRGEDAAMPGLTASTREAARRLGVSDTAIHKAERSGRIAREPPARPVQAVAGVDLRLTVEGRRALVTPRRVPPRSFP